MTTELAELILWLNAVIVTLLAATAALLLPRHVRKAIRRWRQEVAYAGYALHRLGMPDDAHRFDARTRTTQRHVIAYGELPYYLVPKAATA